MSVPKPVPSTQIKPPNNGQRILNFLGHYQAFGGRHHPWMWDVPTAFANFITSSKASLTTPSYPVAVALGSSFLLKILEPDRALISRNQWRSTKPGKYWPMHRNADLVTISLLHAQRPVSNHLRTRFSMRITAQAWANWGSVADLLPSGGLLAGFFLFVSNPKARLSNKHSLMCF